MRWTLMLTVGCVAGSAAYAQTDGAQLRSALSRDLQSMDVTGFQLRRYAMSKVPPLRVPADGQKWKTEAQRIRRHLLEDVVFHGWPRQWVDAPPRFEAVNTAITGNGYRMVKLRYEIVPGYFSTAILYEPQHLTAKVPAILNVNGHVGAVGKAADYKQKRCINFAKRGMLALSLEWIGMGELGGRENNHSYAAHLDLVGANGVGLFYLAMRKGLDYLERHPHADPSRLGVTGLSGGGWQTITLSALDERVAVAVPVAGFSALAAGIEHPEYVGNDMEQNATDFRDGQDYAQLAAMRAPRPTLLIYNATDDCCFRSGIVKEGVFDAIKPFFRLFDRESALVWHENYDPGTHNYELDNRLQAYRFFSEHFGLATIDREIPVDGEIKSARELEVGLPRENLTILGVAKRLAEMNPPASGDIAAADAPGARERLAKLVRYRPVAMRHAWAIETNRNKGVDTRSYLFELDNGLCATGVLSRAATTKDGAPLTIVLNDGGKKSAADAVAGHVNLGEQVLALDLLFTGDNSLPGRRVPEYTQLLAAIGDRPLALEAAQLLGIHSWARSTFGASRSRLHAVGMRSQMAALLAAALRPPDFAEVNIQGGTRSLRRLLDSPVPYEAAPDLFCLGLYKEFDVPRLAALARPAAVTQTYMNGE